MLIEARLPDPETDRHRRYIDVPMDLSDKKPEARCNRAVRETIVREMAPVPCGCLRVRVARCGAGGA
jgi:hypothetical protein